MAGCCGGSGPISRKAGETARDPVCGMNVDCGARDALKLTLEEKDFYFCSTLCMTKFTNNPEAYKDKKGCFSGLFNRK